MIVNLDKDLILTQTGTICGNNVLINDNGYEMHK